MTSRVSKPTCRAVRAEAEFTGKQALLYAPGISAQSVGAKAIHLQIVTIPPGGRAKAHKHDGHETAIYILSGESGMWYGESLEEPLSVSVGDFVYIPASMPHLPYKQYGKLRCGDCPALILTSKRASYCCPSSITFTPRCVQAAHLVCLLLAIRCSSAIASTSFSAE
jgi:uncharacterized RmlC-like cupin family protein